VFSLVKKQKIKKTPPQSKTTHRFILKDNRFWFSCETGRTSGPPRIMSPRKKTAVWGRNWKKAPRRTLVSTSFYSQARKLNYILQIDSFRKTKKVKLH